jgi:hypothetical protein
LTFSDFELIGGKVKALYDRTAVRDIFDIANVKKYLDSYLSEHPGSSELCHKIMLYSASISKHFPLPLSERIRERFERRGTELRQQLYPMLRSGNQPSLESLINAAEIFINDYVLPQDDRDREYLARFANADYRPELLFDS